MKRTGAPRFNRPFDEIGGSIKVGSVYESVPAPAVGLGFCNGSRAGDWFIFPEKSRKRQFFAMELATCNLSTEFIPRSAPGAVK